MTNDSEEAKEIVTQMCATTKGKTASLPVWKLICEYFAKILTTRQNYQVRGLVHKLMLSTLCQSRSSQQRQTFLYFLEYMLPLISSSHFSQVYSDMFLEFREEVVSQVLI